MESLTISDICGLSCSTLSGSLIILSPFDPWAVPTAIKFNRFAVETQKDNCPQPFGCEQS